MYCNDIVQCTRFPPEMQPKQPGSRCFRAVQAIEKVRWTFSTAFTMPRFFVCFAVQKAAAARRKRLLSQAFCRHSIQHEGAPQHRRGSTVCRPLWPANRAASSKPPRFFRHRRRFGAFPLTPELPMFYFTSATVCQRLSSERFDVLLFPLSRCCGAGTSCC